jgi:hypothetical protein
MLNINAIISKILRFITGTGFISGACRYYAVPEVRVTLLYFQRTQKNAYLY